MALFGFALISALADQKRGDQSNALAALSIKNFARSLLDAPRQIVGPTDGTRRILIRGIISFCRE